MEVSPEAAPSEKDILAQPFWMQKFINWNALRQSCPARAGPAGVFCRWEGKNCGYSACPRRIFEEEIVDASKFIPSNKKLQVQIVQLQAEIAKLNKLNQHLMHENTSLATLLSTASLPSDIPVEKKVETSVN